jgi:hypothetical protein
MNDWILFVTLWIGMVLFIALSIFLVRRKQRKLILYFRNEITDFIYGGKNIKVKLIESDITPKSFDTSYNHIREHTLYINENPIVSVWEISTLRTIYKVIFNEKFKSDNLFKILRSCKKQVWQEFSKSWNMRHEQKPII